MLAHRRSARYIYPMTPQQASLIIAETFALYERFGSADYIGEPVSQMEHMSQAAELAIREGKDDEVVLAAFFHDIGHICVAQGDGNSMAGFGVRSHERIGADFLRSKGFPERVAKLVEGHVQAKRYLTFRFPDYYNELSEASKNTLVFQGGIMTEAEAALFENDPDFQNIIELRRWDELAKETNVTVIDLALLKDKAFAVLTKSNL